MDMVKFGLTILAIVIYLAVHLSKVWREQKDQAAKRLAAGEAPEKAEPTELERRVAEAQRRRREQQQEAAALAAGTQPRVLRRPIPIQVVETPTAPARPKTRITYSQPAAKPAPAKAPAALPAPPGPATPAHLPTHAATQAGLGPVASVAKRPVSPALALMTAMLKDRHMLAAAFLLKEVFDKPVSQRSDTPRRH